MITTEILEAADRTMREIGKELGREATMRDVHAALCERAGLDFDACDNFVRAMVMGVHKHFPIDNQLKDLLATAVRHAHVVGIEAARNDEKGVVDHVR